MKYIYVLFIAAGLVFISFYKLQAQQQYPGNADIFNTDLLSAKEYIPETSRNVDIMVLGSNRRLQELAARIKESIGKDPQWYREYVNANAGSSGPLPYNYKFGVSEAEYNEFLEAGTKLQMVKSGESAVDFKWISDSVVQISAAGELSDLNGIEIDLAGNRVKTSFGTLDIYSEINNTDSNSPVGPWTGVQWKLENIPSAPGSVSGAVVKLALGRLTKSGRGILYFNVKEVSPEGKLRRVDKVLFYDL
ncbi:MAG: hypothetical protein PHQ84_01780 [Candidatus Omnitrophica bacterium]|jgi:hypothetical protein|nr:hypothetical protein [Candidatus Omnitrophota bacterium]MDD3274421.1 hypothetical protein [Candidatus Omnitrophota bacterium]MDD5077713.1 hypothetical protein [Candidatus Omnitrophota bacterium]MDD5725062.1 hypothetical protein [Candidatus Omnitrophota bacterium]